MEWRLLNKEIDFFISDYRVFPWREEKRLICSSHWRCVQIEACISNNLLAYSVHVLVRMFFCWAIDVIVIRVCVFTDAVNVLFQLSAWRSSLIELLAFSVLGKESIDLLSLRKFLISYFIVVSRLFNVRMKINEVPKHWYEKRRMSIRLEPAAYSKPLSTFWELAWWVHSLGSTRNGSSMGEKRDIEEGSCWLLALPFRLHLLLFSILIISSRSSDSALCQSFHQQSLLILINVVKILSCIHRMRTRTIDKYRNTRPRFPYDQSLCLAFSRLIQ